jgi:diketogulonate reductase-like aldo/keto reductase
VIAIPKAGRETHLLENWQSRQVTIPAHARAELEAMLPSPTRKRRLSMR